jgi:hypothetical protein
MIFRRFRLFTVQAACHNIEAQLSRKHITGLSPANSTGFPRLLLSGTRGERMPIFYEADLAKSTAKCTARTHTHKRNQPTLPRSSSSLYPSFNFQALQSCLCGNHLLKKLLVNPISKIRRDHNRDTHIQSLSHLQGLPYLPKPILAKRLSPSG